MNIMKNVFKFLVFFLIAGLFFSSCEKDTFTEEDAMEALQKVNLVISVTDASNFNQPIEGATVRTIIDSVAVEKTTDASGLVTFTNVKISGNLNVYISKADYTTAFTTISTTPNDYRQTVVSSNVSIYSLSDENLATVKGQLTIETDLTNRTKEVVAGAEVRVYNPYLPNGCAKNFIGVTDSVGKYEIKVPVNADGNDNLQVSFNSVETSRTVGVKKNNIYSVKTQEAFYDINNNYTPTQIDAVPSAIISIGAPTITGTGFALITEAVPTQLSSAINWDWGIINKGSGYFPNITGNDTTIWVPFSPGTENTEDTAFVQLKFAKNGGLTNIVNIRDYSYENWNNAFYSTKPTIDLNIGGGTGAQIYFDFKLYYNVKISNNGTGYITFPTVKKTYMIDGVQSISNFSYSGNAMLIDGSIYAKGGDILTTIGRYDNAPTFEVIADDSNQAEAYFIPSWMSSDSTLNTFDISWISYGNNYNPAIPPTVTITSLAGYGSGAEFRAEVSANGSINNLVRIHEGSGYVRNINDYKSTGTTGQENGEGINTGATSFYHVLPGQTVKSDIYYGTGVVTELEQ